MLIGSDAEGTVFSEEKKTMMLSRHGAGIVSYQKLIAEQELTLRVKATNHETEVRVVAEVGEEDGKHTYGVAFVDDSLDFWQVDFPEGATGLADRPPVLTLECGGCQSVAEVMNGDFEYDICAIHGGLARYCDECGMLTVWRQLKGTVEAPRRITAKKPKVAEPAFVEPDLTVPLAEWVEPSRAKKAVAVAETAERRFRTSAKVNFLACIRTDRFGDKMVQCIDMSRGGVSFRGRKPYEKDMRIEIAVPYAAEAKEAPAIFVRGRIAHALAMGDEEKWKCGVEFLR